MSSAPPTLVTKTFFGQDAVRQLTSADFVLEKDGNERGRLRHKGCFLVLFYGENKESQDLIQIWQLAASQIAGPIMAAINILVERKVAETLTSIRSDPDSPLHWVSLRAIPTIIVYRGGWPVAVYNGDRAVQPIVDYALTLACEANYREPIQTTAGTQVDGKSNYEMPGVNEYKPRTASTEFKVDAPLRNFNDQLPLAVVGSKSAQQEAIAQAQERATTGAGTPRSPLS